METPNATLDLSSRTIEPTPRDLTCHDGGLTEDHVPGSTYSMMFECDRHGPTPVTVVKCFGDGYIGHCCPSCQKEHEERASKADAEARDKREREGRSARTEAMLARSGIPARFVGKGFESYEAAAGNSRKVAELCRRYAAVFPDKVRLGTGMILCGNAGTGKTHLACAIVDAVIREHSRSARFLKVSKAIRTVKETYGRNSEASEQEAINSMVSPDLLVLDEVGVQFGTDTEKYILFEIINERYEAMKPTILISNLALAGFSDFVGDRVVDRMKENGGNLLIFDWESMRGKATTCQPASADAR